MYVKKNNDRIVLVNVKDIKIPEEYQSVKPREEKITTYRDFFIQYHMQKRFIILDEDNNLISGYAQLWFCKEELGMQQVFVIYNPELPKSLQFVPEYMYREVTFIYGKHEHSECDKEYAWYIPNESKKYVDQNIKTDDIVKLYLEKKPKSKFVEIKITKIETKVPKTERLIKPVLKIRNKSK